MRRSILILLVTIKAITDEKSPYHSLTRSLLGLGRTVLAKARPRSSFSTAAFSLARVLGCARSPSRNRSILRQLSQTEPVPWDLQRQPAVL